MSRNSRHRYEKIRRRYAQEAFVRDAHKQFGVASEATPTIILFRGNLQQCLGFLDREGVHFFVDRGGFRTLNVQGLVDGWNVHDPVICVSKEGSQWRNFALLLPENPLLSSQTEVETSETQQT